MRLDYLIPTRGLIGFRSEFLTVTSGTGLIYHTFDNYGPRVAGDLGRRNNGALVSMATGKAVAYALFNLQERGRLFVGHNTDVYEGMVIGIHARGNDLAVNPLKTSSSPTFAPRAGRKHVLVPPIIPRWNSRWSSSTRMSWSRSRPSRSASAEAAEEHERKKASRAAEPAPAPLATR